MRNRKRINIILKKIRKIWKKNPDWRFCQLFINILKIKDNGTIFYIEDDELLKKLNEFLSFLN